MLLADTDYCRPDSVEAALDALGSTPGARVLAGGQSLINVLKHRAAAVDLLVDVSRLEALRLVEPGDDGGIRIGAATTYQELERSDALRRSHAVVADVAAALVDRQVRSRGTIGGNACFADPASNFPPLLVALQASMEIAGAGGRRTVAAGDFFLGHYRTAVAQDELLVGIAIPTLHGAGVGYRSLQIAADSWALARAAAWVRGNGTIEDARIVLGCVAPTPVRAREMEERLRGMPSSAESAAEAAEAVGEGLEPPTDVHASADYRRDMARVMARRAVLEAIARQG